MREILFRGKTKETGEWRYGFVAKHKYEFETEEVFVIEDKEGYWAEVIPETIGQFTGLTDKNSKRVFEGDILCADTGRRWFNGICTHYTQYVVVVYNSQKARFEILGKLGESHKALDQVIDKCRATVVGNIYDNPELLS